MQVETLNTIPAKRRSASRPRKPVAAPHRRNKTPSNMTRLEVNNEIKYELEKVLLVTLRRPSFKRFLAENPALLLDFKKLVDRGKPPVHETLYTNDMVKRLIGALAVHQPAALLKLAGEKGCAQLKALLVQNG